MFGNLFKKLGDAYKANPYRTIFVCLIVGLVLGYFAVAVGAADAAPLQQTNATAQKSNSPNWNFVEEDYFRKVASPALTYDDYQKYHRDHAMTDTGVVMLKTQAIGDAPGTLDKKEALKAAGKPVQDIIAVSQDDADACTDNPVSCALVSPKALAVLNHKLEQLEKAQRKGAACT